MLDSSKVCTHSYHLPSHDTRNASCSRHQPSCQLRHSYMLQWYSTIGYVYVHGLIESWTAYKYAGAVSHHYTDDFDAALVTFHHFSSLEAFRAVPTSICCRC